MSETDSFIQEVTEEVRRDQMFALWKKWGPFVIGGVVLVVAAAAAWTWMQQQQRAAAEARGSAFIAADPDATEELTALPDQVDGPGRVIAEMVAAAALAKAGDAEAAGQRYAEIAGRAGLAPEYADFAQLQAIRLGAVEPGAALDALIFEDRPYRLLALELRAALRLEAGETEAAHADLNAILADPAATGALRRRAFAVLTASGGEPANLGG